MALSWTEVEGGLENYTEPVEVETERGILRMLNKLKVLEIEWTLEEITNDTPSLAMHWLVTNARAEIEKGNWAECLAWLNQASCLAWHKGNIWLKSTTWDKLDRCIGLIYEIDPDVCSYYSWYYSWGELPVVEDKARTLVSVMSLIRPWVELAAKRTRQKSVRFYLGKSFVKSSPVARLDYLLCAEFISVHFSAPTVRMLVQRALLEVLGAR